MSYDPQKVINKLNEKGAVAPCQRCGHNDWQLESDGFASVTVQQGSQNISLGGPAWALAVITCKNCGNTVFHNLKVLGIDV